MRKNYSKEKFQPKRHFSLKKILIFWQLSLSYTLLMIVPLIMSIAIIIYTHNNLLEKSKQMNIFQLENTMRSIENSLSVIDDLSSTLSFDTKLIQFLSKPELNKGVLTYSVLEIMNSLLPLKDSNKFINGYFVYSLNNDTLVSPDQGFINSEMYYEKYFYYSNMNYDEFKKLLSEKYFKKLLPPQLFSYSMYNNPSILYIDSLFNTRGKIVGQMVFCINLEKIKDLMFPAISESLGSMYIFEKDGSILLSYPEAEKIEKKIQYNILKSTESFEQEINGVKMFISYRVSDKTGWVYLISVPLNDLLRNTNNIMNTIILSLIIFYCIIVAIVYFSLRYNRYPLVNMVKILPKDMVPPEKVMKNGINYISTVVSEIVFDNEHLEERVNEQKFLLRNMILNELESGEIKSEADLNQFASVLNVSFDGTYFRGAYLLIRNSESNITLACYQEILEFLSSDSQHFPIVSSKERNLFILLYQQRLEENEKVYVSIFRSIYHTLLNDFGLEAVIYLGYPYEDLIGVHASFEEAGRLFKVNAGVPPSSYKFLLEYNVDYGRDDYYVYSMKAEQKLVNLIYVYNEREIQNLLVDIYKKNFIERSLTNFMRKILLTRILGTIISFTESTSLAPQLKGSLTNIDPRLFFDLIEQQCIQICETIRQKNEKDNQRNLEQLLEYINENIYNYDLTLSQLALKFNMSESYLSICIKDFTGQNFTSYVEELRMKKANTLLEKGEYSVSEIAEKVGYSNPHSFRRAYKRLYGFSPSYYKKQENKHA